MKIRLIIIVSILVAVLHVKVYAEYIFMKDGSIVEGKIVSDTASSIKMATRSGEERIIQRSNILRILYTELKMGKIYIQKRDGESVVAYMVDEDRNSYTFRKDLYKVQEFKLQRSEVLFMAEKNPSGLKGKPDTESVQLTWLPPYDAVKQYNIYYTKNKSEKHKYATSTTAKDHNLTGLTSNTTYYIIVTSVDSDNYESSPSNELKVTTKNIPPDAPQGIKVKVKKDKSGKKMNIHLAWRSGVDADGKVREYRIYERGIDKPHSTTRTQYDFSNLNPDRVYTYNITSIDDMNSESSYSRNVNSYDYAGYNLMVEPYYIYPLGRFSKVHKYGYGALVLADRIDTLFEGMEFGIAAGYWSYKGANFETSKLESSFMIPVMLTAGYRFNPISRLNIMPRFMAGASYNSVSYIVEDEKGSRTSVEPIVHGGIELEFEITYRFYITAGGGCGAVIEKSGLMPFVSGELGVGIRI